MKLALPLLCVLLAAASPARADKSRRAIADEAREHYQKGITHYDLADYDAAIDEFKKAYDLSKEPGLLFNLAQAARLKKDWRQALQFYENFIGLKPDTPNRADVDAQIEKMKAALAAEQAEQRRLAEQRAAARPVVGSAPTITASPPERSQPFLATRRGRAITGLAAAGAAALITGAITGGVSLADRSDYDAGCNRGACDHGLYDAGRSLAIGTDVLLSLGGACALVAIVLTATRRHAGVR